MSGIMGKKSHNREAKRLQTELDAALQALQNNDRQFQLATERYYIEQIIYEHAALMCRCRALLRELRGGERPCPFG